MPIGPSQLAQLVGLRLGPFQERILRAIAGPEREKLFLLPRGSGKTTIAALDAVHHFVSVEDARVYIAASSEQQASLLFTDALRFARELGDPHVVPRYNHLRWCPDPGDQQYWTRSLEVRAADWRKLQGLTFTRAYLDEMRVVDERVYEAMASGLHKRSDATLIIISTAGQGRDSALGKLRTRALAQPHVRHRGVVTDARGAGIRMLEWSLPADANIDDPRVVKRCNPASWISVEQLAEQRERLPELAYRRFICNQWTDVAGHWLAPGQWQQVTGEPRIEDGADIFVGMDVQGPVCAVVWLSAGQVGVEVFRGHSGPLEAREKVRQLAETYAVKEIAVDPWKLGTVAAELDQDRLPVVGVPATDARAIPYSERLRRAVIERRITVPDDPELRIAAANAVARTSRRGWRLDGQEIAPLVALALALDAAEAAQPEPAQLLGWI